jgi:AcrR family transcriptional regulator
VIDPPAALNGRRAQAARNDGVILTAARDVFLADPAAPISAVASRAGVGISALYRRYPSKDALLRQLAQDALESYQADLQLALDDDGDPWTAYEACLGRVVDGRSQALAQRLAGTFTTTPELTALATQVGALAAELHERTRRAKALRTDVTAADVVLLLEMVTLVDIPGPDGGALLRRRYLALLLQALHAPADRPLPGPAAAEADLSRRWKSTT